MTAPVPPQPRRRGLPLLAALLLPLTTLAHASPTWGRGLVRAGAEGEVGADSNLAATEGEDDPEVYFRAAGWVAASGAPGPRVRVDTGLGGEVRALPLHHRLFVAGAWQARVRARPHDFVEVSGGVGLDAWAFPVVCCEQPGAEEPLTLSDRLRFVARLEASAGGWSGPKGLFSATLRRVIDPVDPDQPGERAVILHAGASVLVRRVTLEPGYWLELADEGELPLNWTAHLVGARLEAPLGRGFSLQARARGSWEGRPGETGPALRAEVEGRHRLRAGPYLALGGTAYLAAPVEDNPAFRALLVYFRVGQGTAPVLIEGGRGPATWRGQ